MESRFDTLRHVANALLDQGHTKAARIVLDMMHDELHEDLYLLGEADPVCRREGGQVAAFAFRLEAEERAK